MSVQKEFWEWIRASPIRQMAFAVAVALLIVVLIPTLITWAPRWLAPTSGLNADQRAAQVGPVRTALLALLAGGVAVIGAIYTARTFGLNRQGQITDRFTRAVDQLGNDKLDVRLGGIYALERLARESRDDYRPIMEIFTAFVREHAPWDPSSDPPAGRGQSDGSVPAAREQSDDSEKPATDVQAILTVLGRLVEANGLLPGLDLTGTALMGADLSFVHLPRAWLGGVHLEHAMLLNAQLDDAWLKGAHLERATLDGAHLKDVNLMNARLAGAFLRGADLEGATLIDTDLKGAHYDRRTKWPADFEPSANGAVPDAEDEGGSSATTLNSQTS
jgi:hypothetical protein